MDAFLVTHQCYLLVVEDLLTTFETFGIIKEKLKGAVKFYEQLTETFTALEAKAKVSNQ